MVRVFLGYDFPIDAFREILAVIINIEHCLHLFFKHQVYFGLEIRKIAYIIINIKQ